MSRGYWPSRWSCEDAGPRRQQTVVGLPSFASSLRVVSRDAPAATMMVHRDPGEAYLLRHTGGDDAISFVERLDVDTLEPVATSDMLPGGPTWPGSVGVHANGDLYVVFGNHAHRLAPDCSLLASQTLPRSRPYNGFVVMDDGTLVTKDFAGARPGRPVPVHERENCELVALDPTTLEIIDRCVLPEPSIARLSCDGTRLSVVGDTSLIRVDWSTDRFVLVDELAVYRSIEGQTYGWDCVLCHDGTTWFLDNGEGSDAFSGTLRGHGVSSAPLHLVRVEADGSVSLTEVCGRPNGLIANPPVVDEARGVAVAYDSGNGVLAAFDTTTLECVWRHDQDHGAHLILNADHGEVITHDFVAGNGEHVVVRDVATGEELNRIATGSGVQSVLFPSVDAAGAIWSVSFLTVSRITAAL